jgi:sterol desaturase/sphingolipid hydroxylase (fatty acid hydroxylase superfamily)
MTFFDLINYPLFYLLNPEHRIFIIYWMSALCIGLIVFVFGEHKKIPQALASMLDRRVWFHPSAVLDFQLMGFNILLKSLFWGGVSLSALVIAKWVMQLLTLWFGISRFEFHSYYQIVVVYTVANFVLLDLARFGLHYLFHRLPFLWEFHKTHHSAQVLNPISLYRTHPVESLASSLLRVFVTGAIAGFFIYLTRSRLDIVTILGVNALDFLFNLAASNLRHSHIWISFGPLNRIFISPAQHQIHHSRSEKHYDKNFGFSLSIWDQLFGTYYAITRREYLFFGVRNETNHNFIFNLLAPFNRVTQRLLESTALHSYTVYIFNFSDRYHYLVNLFSTKINAQFVLLNKYKFNSNPATTNKKEIDYV